MFVTLGAGVWILSTRFNPHSFCHSLFSQDYIIMVQDLEQDRAPAGSDVMLTKLREKLREKEKALEVVSSLSPFHPILSYNDFTLIIASYLMLNIYLHFICVCM